MLAAPTDTQNVSGDSEPTAIWWGQVMAEFAIEAGGIYDRWLHGTTVVAHDPELNSFVVMVPDRFRIDWLRNRLARCVARKLAVMTGRAASVNFILAEEELREAA
jgi:chromosomal replication initiation ATPase DnaA